MKRLAAAAFLAAIASAALGQAAPNAGDRRETVAGWAIEDIANPQDFDSGARALKMARETSRYTIFITFDLDSRAAMPVGAFDVDLTSTDGSNCTIGGGAEELDAAVGKDGAGIRTFLLNRYADTARQCNMPPDAGAEALAGFEQAYALLATWRDQRQGERRSARPPRR
jgi:hypothetical protein